MSVSIIPDLIDALVTQARAALSTVQVYDGYGNSEDPGNFLMVGVDDPDGSDPASSANSQQEFATYRVAPSTRDEQGTITCAALSWNGNADPKAARDGAFAIASAVDTFTRANPSLGLAPRLLWARCGAPLDLSQQQSSESAMALLVFRIAFQARV